MQCTGLSVLRGTRTRTHTNERTPAHAHERTHTNAHALYPGATSQLSNNGLSQLYGLASRLVKCGVLRGAKDIETVLSAARLQVCYDGPGLSIVLVVFC